MPDTAQADPNAADMAARDERHHNRRLAFRCRSCDRLEEPEAAGEHWHPHACRVCGAGVVFGTTLDEVFNHPHVHEHEGAKAHAASPDRETEYHRGGRLIKQPVGPVMVYKLLVPENWEVLHEASDGRLKELGVERKRVARHTPAAGAPNESPKVVAVEARDGVRTRDHAG